MEHLNVSKGRAISDYEAFFILVEKLISAKIEENPKAGIIIAKGQGNEKKFRYKQAQAVLQRLESMSAIHGCFSFGVCETCKKYNTGSYQAGVIGVCKLDGKTHEPFDTCDKHSKEGGGFGL